MAEHFKTNFEYHAPGSVGEVLELLAQYGEQCRVIAGGTDLIPKVKAGILQFAQLISLKNVAELHRLHFEPGAGLTIGACASLRDVERYEAVQALYPALYTGVHSMANTQIRNRGTVVGNICNAVPSADTAPALLVYGAQVRLASKQGERAVPIEEFFTGVCRTVVAPDELVTELFLPEPNAGASSVYYKYTIRKALELAMIGVASNVTLGSQNVVTDVKLALGAVAVTPKRAPKTEALLQGRELTEDLIEAAAQVASQEDCAPISDIRATAYYRREMVRIHVRDALRKAGEAK